MSVMAAGGLRVWRSVRPMGPRKRLRRAVVEAGPNGCLHWRPGGRDFRTVLCALRCARPRCAG